MQNKQLNCYQIYKLTRATTEDRDCMVEENNATLRRLEEAKN